MNQRIHIISFIKKMNYLNTTFVRLALQDFRCFLGQHFPFLGKRHSSSRLMSSRSNFMSKSVTRILSPDRVPNFISMTRSTLFPMSLPTNPQISGLSTKMHTFQPQLSDQGPDLEELFQKAGKSLLFSFLVAKDQHSRFWMQ